MTTFQLDTSGRVCLPPVKGIKAQRLALVSWPDLSPFAQGYVEALFAASWSSLFEQFVAKNMSEAADHEDRVCPEFTDLAPETLARIMADCERVQKNPEWWPDAADPHDEGATFYHQRQIPHVDAFPPLTPYLGDNGLIYLAPVPCSHSTGGGQ